MSDQSLDKVRNLLCTIQQMSNVPGVPITRWASLDDPDVELAGPFLHVPTYAGRLMVQTKR